MDIRFFNSLDDAMGWQHILLQDNCPDEAVYFVHSFMAVPTDPMHRIADCLYGGHKIFATIAETISPAVSFTQRRVVKSVRTFYAALYCNEDISFDYRTHWPQVAIWLLPQFVQRRVLTCHGYGRPIPQTQLV